ncbi:hypothetical protein [Sphingopyxis panaciterrulae]|uniref:Uncharacterized protein n=1 Tax=Sphingopyxis panaciterrulae TaxID=462372 RepID=A0A7W9B8U8_9SPHN|nr:hypothetical protein [Sphingopyxis panaciterrulae]MBB5708370.1 hypothetical protein [Sphingopyxis panaciterrulae]
MTINARYNIHPKPLPGPLVLFDDPLKYVVHPQGISQNARFAVLAARGNNEMQIALLARSGELGMARHQRIDRNLRLNIDVVDPPIIDALRAQKRRACYAGIRRRLPLFAGP